MIHNAVYRALESADKKKFSAIEICISKDMQYQACPSTVKECPAPEIEVRPVP